MEIITNNHWHEFKLWDDLTKEQQSNFDYLTQLEKQEREYIVYKNWVYTLDDFMSLGRNTAEPDDFKGWHGYHFDSFFSGVLIRVHDYGETYQIATCIRR
jgi:hypothetical protein